ncbi:MAG: T9SS C-terminal target domain-containing protein [Cytophagales bacterium]|nr:MAG: T9SS C-terminal target domain-containing protein [Cytophagales bacterium]
MLKKFLKLSAIGVLLASSSIYAQTQVHPLTGATVTGAIQTTIQEVQTIIGSRLANCDDKSPFFTLTITVKGRMPVPGKITFPDMTIAGIAYPSTTVVTAVGNGGQELYIQQGQVAGLSVRRSSSGTSKNYSGENLIDLLAGDSIEVTGILNEFRGMTQLEPINVTVLNTAANLPSLIDGQQVEGIHPVTITSLGDLNNATRQNNLEIGEPYEGMYVELKDVTIREIIPSAPYSSSSRPYFVLVDAAGNQVILNDRFKAGRLPIHSSTSSSSPVRVGEGRLVVPNVGQKYKSVRGMLYHAKTQTASNGCIAASGEFETFAAASYQIHPWHPSQFELDNNVPPIISNIVSPIAANTTDGISISANISAQDTYSITSAFVYYSTDTLNFNTWANVSMTGIGNEFTSSIPNTFSNGQLIYYYIVANDSKSSISVSPNVPSSISGIIGTAKPKFFVVRNEGLQIKDVQFTPFANGRSPYEGIIVSVTGVVTATVKDGSQNMSNVVIQQEGEREWAGLLLGTSGLLSNVEMGQKIRVQGRVIEVTAGASTFTSMDQITAVSVVGSGSITALELPVNTFSGVYDFANHEKYEGMLVKLVNPISNQRLFVVDTNADFTASSRGNFWEYRIGTDISQLANLPFTVTGASRNILISGTRILTGRTPTVNSPGSQFVSLITRHVTTFSGGADTNIVKANTGKRIIYASTKVSFQSMTGIVQNSFGNMKLLPRNDADIELLSISGTGSSEKNILDFTIEGNFVGTITGNTINISVPNGTSISNLTASGMISNLSTVIPSFKTPKDYSTTVLYTVTAQNLTTSVYTVNVIVSSVTKLSNVLEVENKISIFPNPAQNEITIKGALLGEVIHIYNASGKIVYESKSLQNELKINTSSYDSGIYFIRLSSCKTTSKFVIIK